MSGAMSGEGASSRDGDEGSSRVGTTSTAEDVEPEDEAQQQPQRQKAPLGKASKGARAARTQKAAAASVRPVASPLSPQQVQEERMQQLLRSHKEAMRRLALERQQIVQQQAMYGTTSATAAMAYDPRVGAAGGVPDGGSKSAAVTAAAAVDAINATAAAYDAAPWRPASSAAAVAERAAARAVLVAQLQQEQAAAAAALAALKQGKSLYAAREEGIRMYEQQQQQQPQHYTYSSDTVEGAHASSLAGGGAPLPSQARTPPASGQVPGPNSAPGTTPPGGPQRPVGQGPGRTMSLLLRPSHGGQEGHTHRSHNNAQEQAQKGQQVQGQPAQQQERGSRGQPTGGANSRGATEPGWAANGGWGPGAPGSAGSASRVPLLPAGADQLKPIKTTTPTPPPDAARRAHQLHPDAPTPPHGIAPSPGSPMGGPAPRSPHSIFKRPPGAAPASPAAAPTHPLYRKGLATASPIGHGGSGGGAADAVQTAAVPSSPSPPSGQGRSPGGSPLAARGLQRSSAPATPSLLRPAPTPSGQGPGQGTAPPPSAGPRPASDLQELKEQVKALQSAIEVQFTKQPQQPQQPQAAWPPFYPMPMPMYAPPPPPPQQPEPSPPPPPPQPQDPILAGLPPEVASEPAMRHLHAQHAREMAVLKMEIDRARTAAELEQIKALLQQIRGPGAQGPGYTSLSQPEQQAQTQQQTLQQPNPEAQEQAGAAAPPTDTQQGQQQPQPQQQQAGGPDQAWGEEQGPPPDSDHVVLTDANVVPALDEDEPFDAQADPDEQYDGGVLGAAGRRRRAAAAAAARAAEGEVLGAEEAGEAGRVLQPPPASEESHAVQIYIGTAGPFTKRGTYRVRVVLYDGFQPMEAAPGVMVGASTHRCEAVQDDGTGGGGGGAAGAYGSAYGANVSGYGGAGAVHYWVHFREAVRLVGIPLPPTALLVFEMYVAKQTVVGLPSKEALVAWAYGPLVGVTTHSNPYAAAPTAINVNLLQLGGGGGHAVPPPPLVNGPQSVPLYRLPLMVSALRKYSYDTAMLDWSASREEAQPGDAAAAAAASTAAAAAAATNPDGSSSASPSPLEDIPGVSVDAWLRVSRGLPPADAYTPGDGFVVCVDGARMLPANVTLTKVTVSVWSADRRPLGVGGMYGISWPDSDCMNPRMSKQATLGTGADKFDDSTATLLFKVTTLERWSRQASVVGWAVLPVFLDPKTQQQPVSAYVADYVLNQGCYQLPLHVWPPPRSERLRAGCLDAVPRVPCASLLVRLLTPEVHKLQRRKKAPEFSDRVYDSTRAVPTPLERKLFNRCLARRRRLVREAARELISGRPLGRQGAEEDDDSEVALGGDVVLPSSDVELMDWIDRQLNTGAGPGPDNCEPPLNLNRSHDYQPDLGFWVAVDGAMRLPRQLPAAALITYAPPGSFYQDTPLVDDVQVTLDYDLSAPLASPRWTDGLVHFGGVLYEPGVCVIVDVRLVVPSTGTSAPAGWTAIPLFEPEGPFVASGYYHAPLFAGVPSRFLLQEIAAKGNVDAVIVQQLKVGRIKVHEECCSVLVRLVDAAREGQFEPPATSAPLGLLRRPAYCAMAPLLGAKHYATMCKEIRNKSYASAKPKTMTDDVWIEMINDTIIKVAGLDAGDDEYDDDEAAAGEDGGVPPLTAGGAGGPPMTAGGGGAPASAATRLSRRTAGSRRAGSASMPPPPGTGIPPLPAPGPGLPPAVPGSGGGAPPGSGQGGTAAAMAGGGAPLSGPPGTYAPGVPGAGALTAPPPAMPGAARSPPHWPMPFVPFNPPYPYPMYRPPIPFPYGMPPYGLMSGYGMMPPYPPPGMYGMPPGAPAMGMPPAAAGAPPASLYVPGAYGDDAQAAGVAVAGGQSGGGPGGQGVVWPQGPGGRAGRGRTPPRSQAQGQGLGQGQQGQDQGQGQVQPQAWPGGQQQQQLAGLGGPLPGGAGAGQQWGSEVPQAAGSGPGGGYGAAPGAGVAPGNQGMGQQQGAAAAAGAGQGAWPGQGQGHGQGQGQAQGPYPGQPAA